MNTWMLAVGWIKFAVGFALFMWSGEIAQRIVFRRYPEANDETRRTLINNISGNLALFGLVLMVAAGAAVSLL